MGNPSAPRLGPPFQAPPRPGGSARTGLAMSQPGPKPAASPRPRRAARHTQEVSGAPTAGLERGEDLGAPRSLGSTSRGGLTFLAFCPWAPPLPGPEKHLEREGCGLKPAPGQVTGGARGWPWVPAKCTGRGASHIRVGFRGGSAGEESAYNAGDLGSIPGLGRSPGITLQLAL